MEYSSSSGGSMHSCGGGDEEFDESFSAFLNSSRTSYNHASADNSSIPQPQPPTTRLEMHQNHSPSLFDLLSPCLVSTPPPNATSIQSNPDMLLSRGVTASSYSRTSGLMGSRMMPSAPPPPPPSTSGHIPSNVEAVRNPRKRARASRRAPTTVLTTDTSNFRAMVQEYTGIPPSPFYASPFLGNRLNLFSATAAASSTMLPSPLLRPSAHKFAPIVSAVTNNDAVATAASGNATSTNNSQPQHQLPWDLGLRRQSQLTYQSLQQPSTYPTPDVSNFGAKSQTSSPTDSMLLFEEFNRGSHGQVLVSTTTDHIASSTCKSLSSEEWNVIEEPH